MRKRQRKKNRQKQHAAYQTLWCSMWAPAMLQSNAERYENALKIDNDLDVVYSQIFGDPWHYEDDRQAIRRINTKIINDGLTTEGGEE